MSTAAPRWLPTAGLVAVCAYGATLLVIDRCLSVRPSQQTLHGYLAVLRAQAERVDAGPGVLALLSGAEQRSKGSGPFIPAAGVLSAWRMAHAAEPVIWNHDTPQSVLARLHTAGAELDAVGSSEARDLVKRIDDLFRRRAARTWARRAGAGLHAVRLATRRLIGRQDPVRPPEQRLHDEARALLGEALRVVLGARDTTFESLADLQIKAVWLSIFGLAVIAMASLTFHREALFFLGAIGGLLSRLGRLMRRKPSATDYGASSASLILAPVSGAIAGWIGVLLLSVLVELGVLDATHLSGLWDRPVAPLALGLAFLLGFSERLFARVLRVAEGSLDLPKKTNHGGGAS